VPPEVTIGYLQNIYFFEYLIAVPDSIDFAHLFTSDIKHVPSVPKKLAHVNNKLQKRGFCYEEWDVG
jgi:hypothetical protein